MSAQEITAVAVHMNPANPCLGCGCEPEVVQYFRRGTVRVGYQCSCGAVVVDGMYEGHSPNTS